MLFEDLSYPALKEKEEEEFCNPTHECVFYVIESN